MPTFVCECAAQAPKAGGGFLAMALATMGDYGLAAGVDERMSGHLILMIR
jgi:hypothetical protein